MRPVLPSPAVQPPCPWTSSSSLPAASTLVRTPAEASPAVRYGDTLPNTGPTRPRAVRSEPSSVSHLKVGLGQGDEPLMLPTPRSPCTPSSQLPAIQIGRASC